jgi:hypothetical protein
MEIDMKVLGTPLSVNSLQEEVDYKYEEYKMVKKKISKEMNVSKRKYTSVHVKFCIVLVQKLCGEEWSALGSGRCTSRG